MGYYYRDPTAAQALGNINREFSRLEKKARKIRDQWESGKLSDEALRRAQNEFTGIYRHILKNVFSEPRD